MEWVRLTEISNPKQWKTISKNQLIESGYPVYGANGKIGFYNKYNHEDPTILITCRGATCGTLNISEPYSYINGNAMSIDDLNVEKVNIMYLYYFLKYRGFNDVISGSAQPQITRTNLEKILIPLFENKLQLKIVKSLEKIEDIIINRKEQIQSYDDLIESLLKNILNNPNNNKVELEKFLEDITAGKSLAGKEKSNFKVLKTSCVFTGHFDENEWKYLPKDYIPQEKHIIKEGDILVSRMNTSELVGASVYVYKDYEDLTVPDRLWILKLKNNISRIYLWKFFQTNFYRNQIQNISTGTSGSMKNISQKNFRKLEIIYPPIELQNKFADYVIKIEEEKKKLSSSLKELEDLFDALMQEAFSGNLFKD